MRKEMLLAALIGVLAINIVCAYATPLLKTNEAREITLGSNQIASVIFYLDSQIVYQNQTLAYNHSWFYTPNSSAIGYHNLTFVIQNENGTSSQQIDIFVGTLFVAKNETVATINATAESILVEPSGSFELGTFVENITAEFVPEEGDYGNLDYQATRNILNLTIDNNTKRTGSAVRMANGTKYIFPFNTSDNNGTFLFSLNKPAAETGDGQRIIVSVAAGEVRVFPRYDIDGSGRVDIKDSTILKLHMGENTSALPPDERPRYDIDKSGLVNNADVAILKAHYGEIIPTV